MTAPGVLQNPRGFTFTHNTQGRYMLPNIANLVQSKLIAAAAAGSTTLTTDVTLDDLVSSVLAVVEFGATVTVTDAAPYIKVYQADVSDYSDVEEVTALATALVAGMASKQVLVELVRPTKKYIRVSIIRGGGTNNIQIAGGVVQTFNSRVIPQTLPSLQYSRDVASAPAS